MAKLYTVLVTVLLAGLAVATPAGAAWGQAGCRNPIAAADPIPEVPWAQRWFAPERVWPLSQGRGVTVAVIDSGVDVGHPQLDRDRMRAGLDLVEDGGTDGRLDCDGHGTAVASLIGAAPVQGVGFAGLAPQAEILPVRVADQNVDITDPEREPPVTPRALADAVRWAVDQRAQVINVSIAFYHDHEVVADAVRYARDRDAVVVAAVGNLHLPDGPDPTPYPAAYPEVVGVGAIGVEGARLGQSAVGPFVDLVAPGDGVTVAVPGGGHTVSSGTSFAAALVSATAALVRSAEPSLSAPEVVRRLTTAADPGGASGQYGNGVVNPYRALTERITDGAPVASDPIAEVVVDPARVARERAWRHTAGRAAAVAAGAVLCGAAGIVAVALWRRGHRRGWRPGGSVDGPPPAPAPDEPERLFYTVPKPQR